MSYSLYMLRCADGSLYTGIAIDVAQRLEEHRAGIRGAKYLRGRTPVELVFEFPAGDRGAALRLEHRVKTLSKADKELVVAGTLSLERVVREVPAQASGDSSG